MARVDNLIASRRKLRERFAGTGGNGRPRPPLPLAPGVRPMNGDREWLERVRETIAEGLYDDAFTVEALAAALAVHRGQLHRRLKQLTGKAPLQLIGHLRLERASALLETEAASVSEVAYAVGFRCEKCATLRFRKRFGQSWRDRSLHVAAPSARRGPSGSDHSRSTRVFWSLTVRVSRLPRSAKGGASSRWSKTISVPSSRPRRSR